MNRRQIPAFLSMVVLAILMIAGLQKALTDFFLYGWTYSVLTVVEGVESSSVVNVGMEFATVLIFFWFFAVCLQNYMLLKGKEVKELLVDAT